LIGRVAMLVAGVRAKAIDRHCRVIIPLIFVIASIAIFAHPRA
jgi:hypothetical protein